MPTDLCVYEISNDCQREWENFVIRGGNDYSAFSRRCEGEQGVQPLRSRCALCCLDTFEFTATVASNNPLVEDNVKRIVDDQLGIIGYSYQSKINSFAFAFEELDLDVLFREKNKGKTKGKNVGKSEASYRNKYSWVNGGNGVPNRQPTTEDIRSYQCPSDNVYPQQYRIAFSFFYDSDYNKMAVEDYGENIFQSILNELSICYITFQVVLNPYRADVLNSADVPTEQPTKEPTKGLKSDVPTVVSSKLPTVSHSPSSEQAQVHPTHMPVARDSPPTIYPTSYNDAAWEYSSVLLLVNSNESIAQGSECMEDSLVRGMSTSAYRLENVVVNLHYWTGAERIRRQELMVQGISFSMDLSSEVSNYCMIHCLY